MLLNVLVLILRRWQMLTPPIFLIKDKFAQLYQFFGMFECSFIECDCHSSLLLFQSQLRQTLFYKVQDNAVSVSLGSYPFYEYRRLIMSEQISRAIIGHDRPHQIFITPTATAKRNRLDLDFGCCF